MPRNRSIKAKLTVFAEWWDNDSTDWFTLDQFAKILNCARSSLGGAFSWLRRNGYDIHSFWLWEKGCYVYNIKKGNSAAKLSQKAGLKNMKAVSSKLEARVERTISKSGAIRQEGGSTRWAQPARAKKAA